MLFKLNFSSALDLLEPSQTETMGSQTGDDIVESVSIDIVGIHLRPTAAKRRIVMHPFRIALQRGGLFIPAILLQEVKFSIAIHIADAHAMGEIAVVFIRGDRMPIPHFRRLLPIHGGIAVGSLGDADELRFSIARDVGEGWRFIIGLHEDKVPRPGRIRPLGILTPFGRPSGKSNEEHILESITVEVVRKREKIIRIGIILSQSTFKARHRNLSQFTKSQLKGGRRRINLMPFPKIRPLPPPRPRDNICLPVIVKISKIRTLAPKLIRQRNPFELPNHQRRTRFSGVKLRDRPTAQSAQWPQ